MAFGNWKKKSTTAKPNSNASVPNPKINIEKQESSIPPQPKKINIPRPDKVPKNENEMYSDMANLKNSITKVLEERRNGR